MTKNVISEKGQAFKNYRANYDGIFGGSLFRSTIGQNNFYQTSDGERSIVLDQKSNRYRIYNHGTKKFSSYVSSNFVTALSKVNSDKGSQDSISANFVNTNDRYAVKKEPLLLGSGVPQSGNSNSLLSSFTNTDIRYTPRQQLLSIDAAMPAVERGFFVLSNSVAPSSDQNLSRRGLESTLSGISRNSRMSRIGSNFRRAFADVSSFIVPKWAIGLGIAAALAGVAYFSDFGGVRSYIEGRGANVPVSTQGNSTDASARAGEMSKPEITPPVSDASASLKSSPIITMANDTNTNASTIQSSNIEDLTFEPLIDDNGIWRTPEYMSLREARTWEIKAAKEFARSQETNDKYRAGEDCDNLEGRSFFGDLEDGRIYSVKETSRDALTNIVSGVKNFGKAGWLMGPTAFSLSHTKDGKKNRKDDFHPSIGFKQAGRAVARLIGNGIAVPYSLANLVTGGHILPSLPGDEGVNPFMSLVGHTGRFMGSPVSFADGVARAGSFGLADDFYAPVVEGLQTGVKGVADFSLAPINGTARQVGHLFTRNGTEMRENVDKGFDYINNDPLVLARDIANFEGMNITQPEVFHDNRVNMGDIAITTRVAGDAALISYGINKGLNGTQHSKRSGINGGLPDGGFDGGGRITINGINGELPLKLPMFNGE